MLSMRALIKTYVDAFISANTVVSAIFPPLSGLIGRIHIVFLLVTKNAKLH